MAKYKNLSAKQVIAGKKKGLSLEVLNELQGIMNTKAPKDFEKRWKYNPTKDKFEFNL
jgi:hypothetical protein